MKPTKNWNEIVNDWIFDANFKRAINLGQKGLDKCCKDNSTEAIYVECKEVWMFTPTEKMMVV